MKRLMTIAAACVTAVMMTLPASVTAQDLNPQEKTFLTFSSPVELPGMTLPAGTYVFRLADTPGRNVVQVMSEDEETIHGQFLFMQHSREEVTHETVVTFQERAADATPAVQYWYYPGERIGKELIYPEDQARQIAARTGQDVRTEDGVIEGALETAGGALADAGAAVADVAEDVVDVTEDAVDATADAVTGAVTVEAEAAEPEPQVQAGVEVQTQDQTQDQPQADIRADAQIGDAQIEAETERPVGTSGQADTRQQDNRQFVQDELPRTASPLALTGLFGLLSLVGAAGIRFFRG